MTTQRLNALLLLLIGVCLGLHWTLQPNPTERNVETTLINNMFDPVAAEAYSPNSVFEDGKTMQQPVEGTVPRGKLPLRYGTSPEEAQRAGRELKNPYTAEDANALARGQKLYRAMCAMCHGPGGNGEGTVTMRGVPRPPSLMGTRSMQMADGQMFHILTYGQGNMASYATQIERDDRWKVILYVRSLQKSEDQ